MNKKLPEYLLGKYQLIGSITFSVLFAVVFLNLYIPFSDTAWFALGDSVMFFRTLIFALVSILFLIISRILMYKSKKLFDLTYLTYTIWCVIEIISIVTFYTWLTFEILAVGDKSVWEIFFKTCRNGVIALGVPYLISGMYCAIIDKNKTIRLMNYSEVVTDNPLPQEELQKITLFDNNGSLKLSVNLDNLYYIESDDNYIKVWYTDSKGDMKQYMLRCRLKTVEESFRGSALIRCNRKYIINVKKVKILRKESEGYVLDLDNEMIPPLTVTKTYTDAVLSHFTGESPLLEPIDY